MTDWLVDHWVLVTLFVAYAALLASNAFAGKRASDDLKGYYVGGRRVGGLVIGVSFFATFASTNSYIGHAGKGYAYGLPWLTLALLIVVFMALSWTVVAPRLRRMVGSFDALTLPDYLSSRFPDPVLRLRLRAASAVVIAFCSLLYMVAIFKGAGNLFEQFFGIPYSLAIGITLLLVVAYTSVGGFVSVVRTDVVQGVLMLVGAITIFYFVTSAAGGVGRLPELADSPGTDFVFDLNGGIAFSVLLGVALSGALKLLVDPRQLSRFFALRDERSVRTGLWVALIGIAVIQLCLFPVGIYALFLLDGVTDTDLVLPMLLNDPDVFPLFAADFLLVAIVAAAMSSMDSVLLVAAGVIYRDLLQSRWPRADGINVTRVAVLVFALVAAVIALNPPGGIVEITIFSGSLYAVCFFPAVVVGLHWWRGNALAVLLSMTLGVLTLVGWMLLGLGQLVHEVFAGLAASLATYIVISRNSAADLAEGEFQRLTGVRSGV